MDVKFDNQTIAPQSARLSKPGSLTSSTANGVGGNHHLNTSVPCVVICHCNYGHGIARSLGRLGIPVYGIHKNPNSPTAKSKYWYKNFSWEVSDNEPEKAVEWLLELGQKIGSRPIFIPTNDPTSIFLYEHAELLKQAYRFPLRPEGLTYSLANKRQLYSLCQQHDIPTPETAFPQNRYDVLRFIEDAKFPVVLKGIDTVALQMQTGVRMVIAEDGETLLSCYNEMETSGTPNLMLQEYIPGDSADVWMFNGYFDRNSDCLFEVTGRKLRQYPAYTGVTSLGICEKNEAVSRLTKLFMKKIGYTGVLDIGFKYDARRNEYYLLDPNPRVGATFRLFVDSHGMDVVRAMYRDLTGQPVFSGDFEEGRKWLLEHGDIVSSLRYWRDGRLQIGDWLKSFRGVKEAQWFALDDLKPFVAEFGNSLQKGLGNRFRKKTKSPIPKPVN